MDIAFDPSDGSQITPEKFLMRWGNKALGATEDHRPKVRCFFAIKNCTM